MGRLGADPGREQSPCPGTQPPEVQGFCSEGQPWAPLAAHPASYLCSHPWEMGAILPCPSDGAAGKPCSGACPPAPHQKIQESHPDRSYQLWYVPGLGDTSGNSSALPCSQRLTVLRSVTISARVSSHLSSHPRLPLTSLSLLVCPQCLRAVPSALLCFAEELLLGRAVSLQRCLVAMSSIHPRSLAQLSSRGPAQGSTFSAPCGLPQRYSWGSRGTNCETS